MKKRFLSALLAMAMVLTMLPMSAFAATGDPEITTVGYSKDAAGAGEAIGAVLDEIRDSHSWTSDCDKQTMYIAVQGLTADTNYNVKVSDSSGVIWQNKEALVAKAGKDGDHNIVFYFTFNQESKDNQNASVADKAVAAGKYTIALVDANGNPVKVNDVAVTKEVELVADGDDFKVKEEGEEPAQKTPIKSVAITMNGEIEKGAALPEVKVVTDPAEAATATVSSWKQGETAVDAANVNKTAGTYTATFAVVAGEAHELTANTTYTVNGKTVAADALTAELVVKAAQPKMFAGLSMDAATAVADIKAATGLTATLDDEPAKNLLWFVMSGLEPGEYTLSMKNSKNVEVLNGNSVAYDQRNLNITVDESGKYLKDRKSVV